MCTQINFFLVMTRYYSLSVQGYIHSVFNLIVDILMGMIHVMVNCTAQKGYLLYQCHMTLLQLIELSADQLLVLIDCRLRSIMKRP